jgi:5-methylcytosine-specific restriction endonuclease McrA
MTTMFPKKTRIKLSPDEYRKVCEKIYARDRVCQFCGIRKHLTPAHIVRRSQGGDDSPENMMAACVMSWGGRKGCHTRFDQYEIDLPARVWRRMTVDHRRQFVATRRSTSWRAE